MINASHLRIENRAVTMAGLPGQRWAVVLAAGSGKRLQQITHHADGEAVPKQFCSLYGGPSLLRLALARACAVVPHDRVLFVVAAEHERWWKRELHGVPTANVIVQPQNRGTAIGTLLALVVARSRDKSSRIVFLPADHFVADESIITSAIMTAFQRLDKRSDRIILLGLEPEEADAELGYIVPAGTVDELVKPVARFVEKPAEHHARTLIRGGALWNSFIFAAGADELLALFQKRIPGSVRALESAPGFFSTDLAAIYSSLTSVDLSSCVFAGAEDSLSVVSVPPCGWTDLGTPERVFHYLNADTDRSITARRAYPVRPTHVNLSSASQLAENEARG